MLRQALIWAAVVVVGLALGAASAFATLEFGRAGFSQRYGDWTHSRAAGSRAADPYTRAIIAREGLLALSASEALYFTLWRDAEGRPLSEACEYELEGRALDVRWWSVTLYADDDFLAQNTDYASAVDATRITNRNWRVRVAPVRGDAPFWLSSRNARSGFSLTLRLYNPGRDFHPSAEILPVLRTLSCSGAQA